MFRFQNGSKIGGGEEGRRCCQSGVCDQTELSMLSAAFYTQKRLQDHGSHPEIIIWNNTGANKSMSYLYSQSAQTEVEEGRRGGDVASLESVTRLRFGCWVQPFILKVVTRLQHCKNSIFSFWSSIWYIVARTII